VAQLRHLLSHCQDLTLTLLHCCSQCLASGSCCRLPRRPLILPLLLPPLLWAAAAAAHPPLCVSLRLRAAASCAAGAAGPSSAAPAQLRHLPQAFGRHALRDARNRNSLCQIKCKGGAGVTEEHQQPSRSARPAVSRASAHLPKALRIPSRTTLTWKVVCTIAVGRSRLQRGCWAAAHAPLADRGAVTPPPALATSAILSNRSASPGSDF
jgi:hypothetical protein